MLTEIWIRPTITYGLVACFVSFLRASDFQNMQKLFQNMQKLFQNMQFLL